MAEALTTVDVAAAANRRGFVLDGRAAPEAAGGPGRLAMATELDHAIQAALRGGSPVFRPVCGARPTRKDLAHQPRDCGVAIATPEGTGLAAVAHASPGGVGDAAIAAVAAPLLFDTAEQAELARLFDARALTTQRRRAAAEPGARLLSRVRGLIAAPPPTAAGVLDGVGVPATVAAGRAPLPPAAVLDAPTDGAQEVLLDLVGAGELIAALGAQPEARDGCGELYRLPAAATDIVLVRVVDPADGRAHCLRVPPETASPRAGVAWSFGLDSAQYRPHIEG